MTADTAPRDLGTEEISLSVIEISAPLLVMAISDIKRIGKSEIVVMKHIHEHGFSVVR